jgi:hypothetical protein
MTRENETPAGSELKEPVRRRSNFELFSEHAHIWAEKQRAEGKGGWLVGGGFVALLKDNGGDLRILQTIDEAFIESLMKQMAAIAIKEAVVQPAILVMEERQRCFQAMSGWLEIHEVDHLTGPALDHAIREVLGA